MTFRHQEITARVQNQTTTESSAFPPFPQLGLAAPEDLVTYLMVTAEAWLPDVGCQLHQNKNKNGK